jgi:hypothetical protein
MIESFDHYQAYQALFDQYRVMSLTLHVVPTLDEVVSTTGQAHGIRHPYICIAPDWDDLTPVTADYEGFAEVAMKPGVMRRKLSGPEFTMTIVPRVVVEIDTVTGTSVRPSTDIWFSTNSVDVPLRSFKYWFTCPHNAGGSTYAFNYWVEAVVEFRGQHLSLPGVRRPEHVPVHLTPAVDIVTEKDVTTICDMLRRMKNSPPA